MRVSARVMCLLLALAVGSPAAAQSAKPHLDRKPDPWCTDWKTLDQSSKFHYALGFIHALKVDLEFHRPFLEREPGIAKECISNGSACSEEEISKAGWPLLVYRSESTAIDALTTGRDSRPRWNTDKLIALVALECAAHSTDGGETIMSRVMLRLFQEPADRATGANDVPKHPLPPPKPGK